MTDSAANTKFDRPEHLIANKSLRDILADLRKAKVWLLLAAIAAFLASVFFVIKYFVGGEMNPTVWTGEQWANACLGLGITAVITAAQAFLYASGYKGPAAVVATCIVVFFGLFSEVSQSMEREDATVRYRSEHSPVFQAALGSISTLTASAANVSSEQKSLADAKGKWQYWQQLKASKQARPSAVKYSSAYIERQLARFQQQITSLEHQATALGDNRSSLLTGAIAQAKQLEYDEDKHYAMIRLIRHILGVEGIWASFLFSLIIISTFEYAFHFVGAYVADHKRALWLLGRDSQGEPIHPHQAVSTAVVQSPASASKAEANPRSTEPVERTNTPHVTVKAAPLMAVRLAKPPTHMLKQREPSTEVTPKASLQTQPEDKCAEPDARPEPLKAPVRDLTRERLFKLLYVEIRTHILNGQLRPTVRPVTDAVTEVIRHHTSTLDLQPSLIGKPERQKIAEKILEKLQAETILELNADQGVGKPKYVLASRLAKAADPSTSAGSQVVR